VRLALDAGRARERDRARVLGAVDADREGAGRKRDAVPADVWRWLEVRRPAGEPCAREALADGWRDAGRAREAFVFV
jgi:hypothetical protein